MSTSAGIRRAEQADIPTLLDMRERMLIELGSDDPVRLADLRQFSTEWMLPAMAEGRAFGWLAEREGSVVGGVSVTLLSTQPQYRSPRGRIASIYGLYVLPEARGEGTATRLVREAVAAMKSEGIDLVTLHAAEKARPIYERIGFATSPEMRLFTAEWDTEGLE